MKWRYYEALARVFKQVGWHREANQYFRLAVQGIKREIASYD